MPTPPQIIKTNIKIGDTSRIIVFNDSEVILRLQASWNNDDLTGVTLELTNLLGNPKFELCQLVRCQNQFPTYPDYVIMHTSRSTAVTSSSQSIVFNPPITFNTGTEYPFIFKIYENSCGNISNPNCQFDGDTPESKDGAIIIGTR